MTGLVTAFGSGAATNSLEDIRRADCIFVVGSNTSSQHPLAYARISDAVKNHGATLMVVDPRATPVAKLAHVHAPIKSGTNLALINAMMHVIIKEGLAQARFIHERTEGFDALVPSLEHTTPQWAEHITGIAAETIMYMARTYATKRASMLLYCMGITQQVTGTESCRALANLVMLCGMVGRASTGLLPLRGQNNVQGSCDMGALPDSLPGYLPVGTELARERFHEVWGNFANLSGLKLTETLGAIGEGRIKSLFVMGENSILSDPDMEATKKALGHLDFLVVQDLFMTPTAELAHVVLPAASALEKDGTFSNTERRVQRVRAALSPLAGTLPDWRILNELINRVSQDSHLRKRYESPHDIFEEIRTVVPSYAGMTYARLEQEQGICWPCPHEEHAGTPTLHEEAFVRGKGCFTVNTFEARGQQVCDQYPLVLITGRLPHHYHTGTMTRRSWALEREAPLALLEMHPDDAAHIGARDHWNVMIKSVRGSVRAKVRVTKDIRKGHVFLPFHYLESAANTLTSHAHLDPFVKIPELKVSAVAVTVVDD